jgi:hypothetical protein
MSYSFGHEYRIARTPKVCDLCGEIITKGTRYLRWCSVEDYIGQSQAHEECEDEWHKYSDDPSLCELEYPLRVAREGEGR